MSGGREGKDPDKGVGGRVASSRGGVVTERGGKEVGNRGGVKGETVPSNRTWVL